MTTLGLRATKLEFCVECGRPCAGHQHFNLNNPPGLQDYTTVNQQGVPNYGKCDGGGRPELFARILAMREVLRNTPETNVEGESAEEKEERAQEIMELQQEISLEKNQAKIGKIFKVLVDRKESGRYLGRTEFDSVEVDNEVIINSSKKLSIGEFVQVKITKAFDYDLEGEVV
jgi:hypothetical protein